MIPPAHGEEVTKLDGFSFNSVHCSKLSCWYRPDPKERGNDMEDYEISAIEPDHRDGGYFIGVRAKSRSFE